MPQSFEPPSSSSSQTCDNACMEMFTYRLVLNNDIILHETFDSAQEAMDYAMKLIEDPTLSEELDEGEIIWRIDVEMREAESDETLSVEVLYDSE